MTFPVPEPGLVLSYSFLWSDEANEGHVEGRKNRPSAIVLSTAPDARAEGGIRVALMPITHTPPYDVDGALEIPAAIRKSLGLDDEPSWIVVDEINVFLWPGYDLRQIPGRPGVYDYGFLPPRFLEHVLKKLGERRARGTVTAVSRT